MNTQSTSTEETSASLAVDRSRLLTAQDIMPVWTDGKLVYRDMRSLKLKEIDLRRVEMVSTLLPGESKIPTDEHLARLRRMKEFIALDPGVALAFARSPELVPSWEKSYRNFKPSFDGAILEVRRKRMKVLCRYTASLIWKFRSWNIVLTDFTEGVRANHRSAMYRIQA